MKAIIKLGSTKMPKRVDATQIGFDVSLPTDADQSLYGGREAWEHTKGVTHYDALTVACNEADADEVEERLAAGGYSPKNRRMIYAVSGPHGDMLHDGVYAEDDGA